MKGERRQYIVLAFFIVVVLGLMFELSPVFLVIVAVIYILCVPRLILSKERSDYEKQRFDDINAYMSQMAQSFVYTQDVIASLEETASCFTSGHMHGTMREVFEILESGKWDIKRAERDALSYLETQYDCEKVKNLHNYFLRAEELGGKSQKEFQILEHMRLAWQGVVERIRLGKIMERNIGALVYLFFLLVCMIMLRIMRGSDLDIISFLPTQLISMALIGGLALYLLFMDARLSRSLLVSAPIMSEERAE